MPNDEIYSWRLDTALKEATEWAARTDDTSIADLLRTIVSDWLASNSTPADAESPIRMRKQALSLVGTLRGGDPDRAGTSEKSAARGVGRQTCALRRSRSGCMARTVSTVFTINHGDFLTYRFHSRRRFRIVPDRW